MQTWGARKGNPMLFNKEVETVIQEINPAEIFRETLKQESGKSASSEDLRDAYAQEMAERIQKRMPNADLSGFDFDSFFECAIDTTYPVRLEKEDGDYFATAIDVPHMVAEVCDELTANEKQALSLHCLKTALTQEDFEIECAGETYRGSSLAAETPRKGKNHSAVKKFFAAALIAASTFFASLDVASAETLLGTLIIKTDNGGFQQQLMRGKDDKAFTKSAILKKQIANFKGKTLLEQIKGVHAFWNQFRYKSDQKIWGRPDHWATTSEFLAKKGGDCEDYALAKYWTLRALGVPADRMRVLVGKRIKEQQDHAVLVVKDDSGQTWILDNLEKEIVAEKDMYLKLAPKVLVSETGTSFCMPGKQLLADLEGKSPFDEKAPPAPAAMTVSLAQGM